MTDETKDLQVAIFPCGSEIGLEIHNALRSEKNLELHGLTSTSCHGATLYQNYYSEIPWIKDPDFIDVLNAYLEKHDIDVLFPAYDDVILFLSKHRDRIKTKLVLPDHHVCQTARSKKATYAQLAGHDFVPQTYATVSDVEEWPVFAKPDIGQGAQGARIVMQSHAAEINPDIDVICELLPGEEYTVDCFSDRHGQVRACMPRARLRTKSGISVRTQAVSITSEIENIAQQIQEKIPFRGGWFFQVKRAKGGNFKLLEVAARIGGSMGIHRTMGVNFPLLSIYDHLGKDVEIEASIDDRIVDRFLGNRYFNQAPFAAVYVDYDDTITCRGDVNSQVMAFLYNCRNRQIPLYLITRHAGEIDQELTKRGISGDLFERIIHIRDKSPKSGFITEKNAIFIDDSFSERREVSKNLGIPAYAVEAVESLIDWRWS